MKKKSINEYLYYNAFYLFGEQDDLKTQTHQQNSVTKTLKNRWPVPLVQFSYWYHCITTKVTNIQIPKAHWKFRAADSRCSSRRTILKCLLLLTDKLTTTMRCEVMRRAADGTWTVRHCRLLQDDLLVTVGEDSPLGRPVVGLRAQPLAGGRGPDPPDDVVAVFWLRAGDPVRQAGFRGRSCGLNTPRLMSYSDKN